MDIPYIVLDSKKKAQIDMGAIIQGVKEFEQGKTNPVYTDLRPRSDSYVYDMNGFIERFSKIDSMSDDNLQLLINETYGSILDAIDLLLKQSKGLTTSNPYYVSLVGLFTNQRFVSKFANTLKSVLRMSQLPINQRVTLNRIIYNYTTLSSNNKDKMIETMLINIADIINVDILPTLIGIGLPKELATMIAISSKSSMDDFINVKRVNLCIFNCGSLKIMTLQRIVDIYQNIFNRCMTILFEAIMFDVYSEDDLRNATEDQREIYSLIVTAVLEMINQMPISAIKTILMCYASDYAYKACRVRSNLNLSQDYYRINEAIDLLKIEGIYIS